MIQTEPPLMASLFYLSKILAVFTQPLTWAAALLLLALWCWPRRPAAARWLLLAALGLTGLVGWLALPDALLRALENRSPPMVALVAEELLPYTGVVVLGGAIERQQAAVALLRQHPHLRLLFTGGDGSWWGNGPSEAKQAEAFFTRMGVAAVRTLYERTSRTTYENAALGAAVPGVDMTQRWLLITTASHMPRALATFQAVGWNVTPYPVGFRAVSYTAWTDYSLARGARLWQLVLHEIVGMGAFTAVGLTNF
jgi:uncharacterized SAM-binding protein YcdF (DUF218 family)